jgi:hypothetical protein
LESKHRIAGIGFYVLDLLLIAGFVWANTNITRGATTPLAESYMTWVSPLTFMNTILTWGVLYILDPENRLKYRLLVAEQEADLIDVEAGILIRVTEAEQKAHQKLLHAGIDINQNNQNQERFSGNSGMQPYPRPVQPEPISYPQPEPFFDDPAMHVVNDLDEAFPFSGNSGKNHSPKV